MGFALFNPSCALSGPGNFGPTLRQTKDQQYLDRRLAHASLLHFAIKLFFAAPCIGLPSALTALGSQASVLHFFTKLFLAAPCSGLPIALTAWVSQDCAIAVLMGKNAIEAARAEAASAKAERAKAERAM